MNRGNLGLWERLAFDFTGIEWKPFYKKRWFVFRPFSVLYNVFVVVLK